MGDSSTSGPVWLLSTRGRPKEAQETIDACHAAGMTSRGVVYIDETPYPKLKLPKNWSVHYEPRWLSLQGSMQWCFHNFNSASHFGWLADDVRPRTHGWDKLLEEAAGGFGLSYARDLWHSEDRGREAELEAGINMSSGLCWAGDLVRTVGWWALPGVRQAGIDTAWLDIVRPLGLHRYRRDVVVEHLNWRTGKRPKDDGDDWSRDGTDYVNHDLDVKARWSWSPEYRATLLRVSTACGGAADSARFARAARAAFANETKTPTWPSARVQNIMEGVRDPEVFDLHTDTEPKAVDP